MTGPGAGGRLSLKPVARRWRRFWTQWSDWFRMARRLVPFAHRQRRRFAWAVAFGIGYTATGIAEPWILKLILDNVILDLPLPGFLAPLFAPVGDSRLALLNVLIGMMVGLVVLRGLFYYYQSLLIARVGQRVTADLRLELFSHLQRLSFQFHDRRRTGDLIARLTSDIRFLRDIFVALPISLTRELLLILGMLAVMFAMDWSLTLLAMLALPGIAVILRTYQRPMRRAIRRQRDREGDLATIAAEALGAVKVVQGFGQEEKEIDRFGVQNKRSLRTGLKAARLEAKLRWYAEVTVAVVMALVMAVAARRVLAGSLSPGDLIVFVRYLRTFARPLRRVSRMAERTARGVAAGERVMEMLDVEPGIESLPGARAAPRFAGNLAFEDVTFRHRGRGRPTLKDLSLRVEAGERVAIVGSTGAGKTTLVSLIPRFYDPMEGRVTIDGTDVRDYTLASLRENISIVFQEPILFSTTIAENIAYGRPGAGRMEIVAAAQRAGIHGVVSRLPGGYDTLLGERGGTLSGGERQCVAIARAMIKDAPIVILDEPTTGLDSESSGLVVRALGELIRGRTAITISHHFGALHEVDRVFVLDAGSVVEEGTPAALGSRESRYNKLRRLQMEAL